ncbi:hypothetical protein NKJ35_08830 [Mesorhizobium sp. M0136]|uniref:hypothetical protein n=1 Tax=Mesorhizobium sp. M0136 TaxID=2956890 RepID=UPI00333CC7DA
MPAVRLPAMLASAGAVMMAVQDATRTIAAEQLVFSGPLLLACLAVAAPGRPRFPAPAALTVAKWKPVPARFTCRAAKVAMARR